MRDRLVTAAGAALALFAVYALFFHRPAQRPVTRPTSIEKGRNGYAAVAGWLEHGGIRVASLRRRFDTLSAPDSAYTPHGNVLITTMPHAIPSRPKERRSLRRWVDAGNTLLVLAALDDTPEWALGAHPNFLSELTLLTGLRFVPHRALAQDRNGRTVSTVARSGGAPGQRRSLQRLAQASGKPPVKRQSPVDFVPTGEHPLFAGVRSLRGFSDETSALWQLAPSTPTDDLTLRLATERSSGLDAVWERSEGTGRIIVAASGSLLTNRVVAQADAASFVANIVGRELGPGGTVIFDDMHQGLSVLYDPSAFFRDSRLHVTLLFLIALWLAYVLGSSSRFGPPARTRRAPRQRDFLQAVGGFLARRLDTRDAGLLMFREWFAELRAKRGIEDDGHPPWRELRATPALDAATRTALERAYARIANGRQVDPVRLHNLINKARKAIG